jgi:peptidoglycan/xylan/chitin deacetylase (PgdA/CDA1 family)
MVADNVKAFVGAAVLVVAVSAGLVASGLVGGGSGSADPSPAVLGDTTTPGVSDTPTPAPSQAEASPTAPPGTPITSAVDVPIMMYHIIGPPDRPENDPLAVSTDDFSAQMSYLACAGYTPITVQQLFDAFDGNAALPEKPIILTFDDGWEGDYADGYPILKEHGFVGSFAIVTGYVDAGGPYVTWAQIKEMSDAGMEMMSHTVTHIDLGTSDDETDIAQLAESKATLEEKTGKPVDYFVYPAGEPFRTGTEERQGQVVQLLKDAGYRGALLDGSGYGGQDPAAPYQLNRVRVSGGEDIYTYAGSIYGPDPDSVSCP